MDRRWPWKKKSSDKTVLEKAAGELDSAAGAGTQVCIHCRFAKAKNWFHLKKIRTSF